MYTSNGGRPHLVVRRCGVVHEVMATIVEQQLDPEEGTKMDLGSCGLGLLCSNLLLIAENVVIGAAAGAVILLFARFGRREDLLDRLKQYSLCGAQKAHSFYAVLALPDTHLCARTNPNNL